MRVLSPLAPPDVPDLCEFPARADLTISGLDAPTARLWLLRDAAGCIAGSTGFEVSEDGNDVLIRSVAVDERCRGQGLGLRLAQFALEEAARQARAERGCSADAQVLSGSNLASSPQIETV